MELQHPADELLESTVGLPPRVLTQGELDAQTLDGTMGFQAVEVQWDEALIVQPSTNCVLSVRSRVRGAPRWGPGDSSRSHGRWTGGSRVVPTGVLESGGTVRVWVPVDPGVPVTVVLGLPR